MENSSNNLIKHITDSLPGYSRAFKQLAEFILNKTFAVSTMSIEELAIASDVSVATVNRFAHECGFDGYPLFRAELRSVFEKIFEPAEKIRSGMLRKFGDEEVLESSFNSLLNNIQNSKKLVNPQSLKDAIDLILSAKNVFVAGMGVSALHATFMVEAFEPFLATTIRELNGFGGPERAFRKASMVTEEDLIIVISLPRYSKSIIELMHLVKGKNARVLALTDTPASPVVPLADVTLFASSEHPLLYASNAPIIALIEGLSASIALRVNHSAEYITQQTESVLPYFYLPVEKDKKVKKHK
ncbi:MurR/RpiR family transcriptional regulator [Neisseria sp. Ec49-e6-T10]|uniref:MurR/RpiR family transcriptional regulator n=1 Tax=Neisseria sp. Ec49-e6-T10 TaxID=3140744 RepID=UPI003EB946E9